MATLGERIAQRRAAMDLTQDQLAERVGVKAPQISRWERGEVAPELKYATRLADALATSLDYLLRDLDLPAGLAEVVADPALFERALEAAEIEWAIDEVRSHGDVPKIEWVKRFNARRRRAKAGGSQ